MVNNIEVNVSNAAEYISRAKEETKKAVRYQKKSRRVSVSPSLLSLPPVFVRLHFLKNKQTKKNSYTCAHNMLACLRMCFETKVPFIWQKYIIIAFALLILLAVIALIVGLSVGLTKPPLWELRRHREFKWQNNSVALFAVHTFSLFVSLLTSATFLFVLSEVLRWNVALPQKAFWLVFFFFLVPPTETRLPRYMRARRFPAYSHHIRWNLWVMDVTAHDLAAFSCSQLLRQWTTSSRLLHFATAL